MTEVQATEGITGERGPNRGADSSQKGKSRAGVVGREGHPSHVGRDVQTKSKDSGPLSKHTPGQPRSDRSLLDLNPKHLVHQPP